MNHLKNQQNIVVLAVPRGGLAIGSIVAQALEAPLDIILAKKIGAPYNPEFAIGAATQTFFFVNQPYKNSDFEQEARTIQELLNKRSQLYRQVAPTQALAQKTIIICDDGVATGHTVYAAIQEVKQQKPRRIIVAAPVISADAQEWLEHYADEVISVIAPVDLSAIGAYYQQFEQVSDEEAAHILKQFKQAKKGN